MPTVRDVLGDEFATLQGQGKSKDEIIAIAKDRLKNPPQIKSQITQQIEPKSSVPKWYLGETDNGLINFGGDVLRGAGKTGLNYFNVLQDTFGVDNTKTTNLLQKLDNITEEHKSKTRTQERQAEVDSLNKTYQNADRFSDKFSAGLDSVYDTISHPKEWQIGEFIGENLDPINTIPIGRGVVAGATIGGLTNGVQSGGFAQARDDKSDMDVLVEGALGATAGAVLGGVTGGLTKKVAGANPSDYNAAYEGLGINSEENKYKREDYYRDGRNPAKADANGVLTDPFDVIEKKRTAAVPVVYEKIVKEKAYNEFATLIKSEEKQIPYIDAQIKQIGYEMKLKGASDAEVEVAVAENFSPSPQSLAITNIINDGLPVTPRLSGLNIQQAIINSINNPTKTSKEFYDSMKLHGFVDDIAIAATKAYDTKDLSEFSVVAHDKLTRNMPALVDMKKIDEEAKTDIENIDKRYTKDIEDNSYKLAHEALPIEEQKTKTKQSALFGDEQQLFDVPSETKLVTPKWAEKLLNSTTKYEDIVRDITNAKNGETPTPLAKRAMLAQAKEELKTLSNSDRYSEVLDMTRDIKGTQSPQRLESEMRVSTVNNPDAYRTTVEAPTYSKNYQYDFMLTEPRVKRIEEGKATLQDIQYLKADLDMIEHNPLYAAPTEAELRAKYDEWANNLDAIYDYAEFDRLEQKFEPELYAEKQELFGDAPTTKEEIYDDTSYTGDLARDSQNTIITEQTYAGVDANERGADRSGSSQATAVNDGSELFQQSDSSTSNSVTNVLGEQSDTELYKQDAENTTSSSTPRDRQSTRSGGANDERVQTQQGAEATTSTEPKQEQKQSSDADVEQSLSQRVDAQKDAEFIEVDIANPQNIHETLPMLLTKQRDDVVKAEQRFFESNERGMLFTNGTGTGKTFTGLGTIKRFERMGKKDIVITVPSEAKALDWIEDGKLLNINIRKLKDTKDSGDGDIVVTTYENLRENKALTDRDIDLYVADESHKIMGNKDGKHTANLAAVRELTNHVDVAKQRAREEFAAQREELEKMIEKAGGRYEDAAAPFVQEQKALIEQELQRAMELNAKTKTVFLSASPFASHKSLRYADDYLFNFEKNKWSRNEKFGAYNSGDAEDNFFISNFGYKMRYNKLTRPDAEVNVDLMERAYAEKLRESGAMSGRMLDVDKDYQRAFVLVDSEIGKKIDAGFEKLNDDKEFTHLRSIMRSSYMDTVALMESIKASEAVSRIRDHLDDGRKVVIYHTFVDAVPKHPFRLDAHINKAIAADDTGTLKSILTAEYAAYKSKYPDLYNMDLGNLDTPTSIISQAFGDDVVMFNRLAKSQKHKNIEKFNNNIVDIIMVNESGKEGISLHDKNGDKQRVEINLTLPIKPIDMIQVEGRIYRTGQKSDAIFEYLVLHTNFEKRYFGSSINERVATVENLAMGEQSRSLRSSIKNGYMIADVIKPSELTGKGGKAYDARAEGDTVAGDPFAYAKTLYFGKKKGRQNNRGADFFATPDPLGLKMVEWADIKANERVLEPSAGVGAIGKWFPSNTTNHFIEQSSDLASDLRVAVAGDVKQMSFEDLDIINKYDAIVMNPPFGRASATAIKHLQKAMSHTAMNGRIVLLAPNNMIEKSTFKTMLEDKKYNGWVLQDEIKLSDVVFKRAGTKVMTSVYVFDKTDSKDSLNISNRYINDIKAEDINSFFDDIENFDVDKRDIPEKIDDVEKEVSAVVRGNMPFEIGTFKHTKTGEDMTVVKFADRVSKEEYSAFAGEVKEFGGYWSRYAKGFLFKNEAQAEMFKQGVDDGSLKLNGMFFPYADKFADVMLNFDKYADAGYEKISNIVRDLDSDGVPKAVRESKNMHHAMVNNFFGWLRDNMVLGGGRTNHYLDVLRDYTNQKSQIAHEALDTREALSHLSSDDSMDLVRALGGDLPIDELADGMVPIYEKFRKLIDIQTEELVKAGALDEKYVKENYIKRYYFEHIAKEKSFVNMKGSAANSKKFAREDLTLDERMELGQFEDASYVVAKTIMEQKDQLNRARFFNKLANEVGVDEMVDGFVKVPDVSLGVIKKWGALSNKYIPKQVYDDLVGAAKMFDEMTGMEQIVATWFSTVQHIKTNMTVKNIGTHVYNVLSNGYIAYLDGHMTELGRVMADPKLYKQLHDEANRFGLDSMLDDLEGIAFKEHTNSGLLTTLLKNAYMAEGTKFGDAMRKAYAHEDAAFKIAAYLKRKEEKQLEKFLSANPEIKVEYDSGVVNAFSISKRYKKDIQNINLTENELRAAFEGVDEVYVNYGTPLPSGVKNLDRSGLMPFMHYTWKATPIFLKQMMRHPYKVAMLHVLAGSYGLSKIWGEQDEREEVTPEWMNDGFNMLGLDNYKEITEGEYLNIGRSVPGMRFMDKSPLSMYLGFDGGILANMFGIVMQGRDNKGYAVDGGKYDTTGVKLAKRASTMAEQAMPPLFPAVPLVVRPKVDSRGREIEGTTEVIAFGGRYFQKAYDAVGGKKDKRGNPLEVIDVVKQAVGAKLQKIDKLEYAQKSVNKARKLYEREFNLARSSAERVAASAKYKNSIKKIKAQTSNADRGKLKIKTSAPGSKQNSKIGRVFSKKQMIKL